MNVHSLKLIVAVANRESSEDDSMNEYRLRLYVSGRSARSEDTVHNLRRICEQHLRNHYQLEIIDVVKQPDRAEQDKILATPTLIKEFPPPRQCLIGDLSDAETILQLLGLHTTRSEDEAT